MRDYKIVIDKSTVRVGTADCVRSVIAEQLARRGVALPFAVVSNPEFLKEGSAVASDDDPVRPHEVLDRRRA